MKKMFLSTKQGFAAFLLVAFLGLFGIQTANAQDPIPVQLGVPVTIGMAENYNIYEFTAPETGILYVKVEPYHTYYGHSGSYLLFSNPECTNGVPFLTNMPEETTNGWIYSFEVKKAGTKFYFTMRDVFILTPADARTFTFTMSKEKVAPRLTLVYPQPGSNVEYNFALAPEMQIIISPGTSIFDTIELNYIDNNDQSQTMELSYYKIEFDSSYRIDMAGGIAQIKSEIKDKTPMSVVIKNVSLDGEGPTGNFAKGNDFVIPYLYIPMTVASHFTWPSPFLSYWPEGDEAGIVTIEFDGPLAALEDQPKGGMHPFAYSLHEGEDYESEDGFALMTAPKVSIDGNKLILDFTGVERECNEAVVTMVVQGLVDINGNLVFYNGNNQIWEVLPYEQIQQLVLAWELTPGPGSSLINTQDVELWINNEAWTHLVIEGFNFDCGEASVVVSIEDCTQEADPTAPNDYTLIYIPVPELAKVSENVTMSAVIRSLDGNDYEISADYKNEVSDTEIVGIGSENVWTVYNLQGVKVLTTGDYNAVKNLPAGIYIVNGKKISI